MVFVDDPVEAIYFFLHVIRQPKSMLQQQKVNAIQAKLLRTVLARP
jgi:hypothetical protein